MVQNRFKLKIEIDEEDMTPAMLERTIKFVIKAIAMVIDKGFATMEELKESGFDFISGSQIEEMEELILEEISELRVERIRKMTQYPVPLADENFSYVAEPPAQNKIWVNDDETVKRLLAKDLKDIIDT